MLLKAISWIYLSFQDDNHLGDIFKDVGSELDIPFISR